jgi:hypothetical protein
MNVRRAAVFYASVVPFAILVALLEIAIEGPNGWAKGLYNFGIYWDSGLGLILGGGKPWTPYHFLVNCIYLLALHFYFWKGESWTGWVKAAKVSARCLAWLLAAWALEDFLWFVLNPFYGLSKLNPQNVWWHNWIGPVPDLYVLLPPVSLLLYWLSTGSPSEKPA